MKNLKKKIIYICKLITFLSLIITICSGSSIEEKTIYHELTELEYSELSNIYNNNGTPGFETYSQALSSIDEYPMYSYTLFLKCRKLIIQNNTNNLVKNVGEENAVKMLMKVIEMNMSYITEERDNIKPKTIACAEWFALAENDLNNAEQILTKIKEYENNDYNITINLLINLQYTIHKSKNLFIISKKRNNPNSTINSEIITSAERNIALKWIKLADDTIKSNSNGNNMTENSNNILKRSKNYYDTGNYYLAIMDAAEGKVSTEYIQITNSIDAIKLAKKSINDEKLEIAKAYHNSNIDAPLAELEIELAKLHLKDAEKDDTFGVTLLAYSSIQEALIANEQINAIMDLKNSIENPGESTPNSVSRPTPFGLFPLIGAAVAVYISRRWQHN